MENGMLCNLKSGLYSDVGLSIQGGNEMGVCFYV